MELERRHVEVRKTRALLFDQGRALDVPAVLGKGFVEHVLEFAPFRAQGITLLAEARELFGDLVVLLLEGRHEGLEPLVLLEELLGVLLG